MTRRVLGLLHTAESHRARFDRLLTELAPQNVGWVHCVREVLLRQALDTFPVNTIAAGIEAALATLQSQGATQALCTCSSVGGMAEQVGRQMGLPTLRVDRPMAEAAVAAGRHLLVAACLPSTLGPTTQLLNEVAYAQNRRVEIETLLMENAWPLFQAGDEAGFARHIADIILHTRPRPDAIVLAQASMAGAADLLKQSPVPVLASPRLGVASSLGRLTATAGRADMAPGTNQGRIEQGRMA
ncbi:MAG: arylsulfatase [Rhodospirillum sp.]|nr:arylsulfatase [Rhodospirillum sp.]